MLLPSELDTLSPVYVAVGTLVATTLAYKLLFAPAPHERYAKAHGLAQIKLPRRLHKSSALLGDMVELAQNGERFFDWIYEKVLESGGAPWVQRVPSLNDLVIVATPELFEDMAKTQAETFEKGALTYAIFYDFVGHSLFALDGEPWFHQRKTASKFFTARMFRNVATTMINAHAEKMYAVLDRAQETHTQVNFTKLIHEFTLETFAELGFGLKMNAIGNAHGHPLDQALAGALPQILRRTQMPAWLWKLQKFLKIGGERAYATTTAKIREIVSEMVSQSLAQSEQLGEREDAATIVELFIHAMRVGEGEYSPEVLRDIAITFVAGGRDTSADTLNWVLFHLGKHPAVEARVREELWTKFPDLMQRRISALSMDQTQTLVYTEAVIRETLRLYPVVPLYIRRATKDTVLVDGTFIAEGTSVGMCPYAAGRLESVWGEDALQFKPERFIDESTGKLRVFPAYKFCSFGAGPRICIGMNLAMLEMKLVLCSLLSRFQFEAAPNDGAIGFSASLALKHPLLVHVKPAPLSAAARAS